MNNQNVISVIILLAIIAIAVYGTVKRIRFGSSCCGTKEPAAKRVKVKDRNKAHYPYRYVLNVDGMHCTNCARRIENTFNKTEGRWAVADVGQKKLILLSKHEEQQSDLISLTAQAGYTMISYNEE
ncbi:MAG: heavy-metal-associated domain-containing protein [Lachnospiraceae bacterium]|nr:heavy-metal-associated domain-containing protein [Lachnospiraceae bacterium]